MNATLDNLFDDIKDASRSDPKASHLTFVTEVDATGSPCGYGVYGDVFDHESNEWFAVAEYSPKFNRAFHSLNHYKHYFNVTDIKSTLKVIEV